jgi:hypothetical protein
MALNNHLSENEDRLRTLNKAQQEALPALMAVIKNASSYDLAMRPLESSYSSLAKYVADEHARISEIVQRSPPKSLDSTAP